MEKAYLVFFTKSRFLHTLVDNPQIHLSYKQYFLIFIKFHACFTKKLRFKTDNVPNRPVFLHLFPSPLMY